MYVCTYVADDRMEVSFINFYFLVGGWVGGIVGMLLCVPFKYLDNIKIGCCSIHNFVPTFFFNCLFMKGFPTGCLLSELVGKLSVMLITESPVVYVRKKN